MPDASRFGMSPHVGDDEISENDQIPSSAKLGYR